MARGKMDLSAFVGKLLEEQDGDTLREGIRVLSQALMETEVSGLIAAERYERSGERSSYRNGYRMRSWDTRMGTIELAIPKIRPGNYFPSLLEPRRRAERALQAVVQEGRFDAKSRRSAEDTRAGRDTFGSMRRTTRSALDGRVQSMATVVAIGVTKDGERQVLGVDAGPSEEAASWTAFLRDLVKRGLGGVRLVISDAHEGIKKAVSKVLVGSSWQRCRVHFMGNLLAKLPHSAREPVGAIVRTIFAQPDHETAMAQLRKVADGLRARFQPASALLEEAAEDILGYRHFPNEHRRQLHSTNPLERLNKEIKRRSNVVGIFPNRASLLRLVGAILAEQDDEWAVAERRYFSAESMRLLEQPTLEPSQEELLEAVG